MLHVGRSTFYKLLKLGDIGTVYIGSARRIVVRDLEAYVEQLKLKQKGSGMDSGNHESLSDEHVRTWMDR
jgi:excisionase family DNA binding protein